MRRVIVTLGIAALLLLAGCAAPEAVAPSPTKPPGAVPAASTPGVPASAAPKAAATAPASDRMAQLIEAARKEGTVNWAITPPFFDGVGPMRDLIKQKYGVDLKIEASSELNYTRKVAKIVSEVQAGAPASFDLIDLSDSTVAPLLQAGAALKVNWQEYMPQIPAEGVIGDGILLVNYNDFLGPVFNPKIIPADQAPRSYDDLLDPKWKGKISTIDAQSNWVWLAQPDLWGEARLKEFMKGLKKQNPFIGRYDEMQARLTSGEYPLSAGITASTVTVAQRKGAPLEYAKVTPMRVGAYGSAVPKNAPHPNAAILLALATLLPEAQAVRDQMSGGSLGWVEGTYANKFIKENKVAKVDVAFGQKNSERLAAEISDIMRGN